MTKFTFKIDLVANVSTTRARIAQDVMIKFLSEYPGFMAAEVTVE